MKSRDKWLIAINTIAVLILLYGTLAKPRAVAAQTHKPFFITHIYTGPDGLSHSEEIEANFAPGPGNDIFKMMKVTGAELHRSSPGHVADWHVAPRRQYGITLSGRGELEVAGGKKISMGPGQIEMVEDTTGKGHITRVIGNEDRVVLFLALADQAGK
jgi:hypothetical protein